MLPGYVIEEQENCYFIKPKLEPYQLNVNPNSKSNPVP